MAPDDGTDLIEAVVTCEGNLHDPDFNDRFQILLGNLKSLLYKSKEEDKIKVKKVEPWNSVRVTISIPKEAAQKLRLLAQQGSNVLKSLGILTVQLQGDQVISLTLAGQNNSPSTEIVLRQSDGTSSSSSLPFTLPIGGPTGPSSLVPGPSLSSSSSSPSTSNNNPTSSSSAFRSPNVVAPTGETIPVLPPPPPPSTKGSNPLTSRGPFPFTSMTHAAQTMQRTDSNMNSQQLPLQHQQQVPPTTTTVSSSPVVEAAGSSSAVLSSTSTVKSNNNNNNLIHNAVNSTNSSSPVVSSPQLTHQQSSLIGQQQQQVAVTTTSTAINKSSEQVSRFVLQPHQQQQQQLQLLQNQQQQTNLYHQQQSQSLQLQIVNVNAPPPYPGVNISSSSSVNSGVVNVTGHGGTVVSVSNFSSSISSNSSLAGNINLLGNSNSINFVGSNNNNSNNVHHLQQQQQQTLNSAILSSSGGTIASSASVVCVGASSLSSSSNNASNNSNLTLVRSVSTPSMMTSQQLLDDLLGGPSGNNQQQPMCSPLLVNLLQNNDAQSSQQQQQSGNSSELSQQQPGASGQASVELQKQRFILQQQHVQQLQQQRKIKRVMSLDGASPEVGTLVRPSAAGGSSGPASPAVVTTSSSGDGISSAVLLPSSRMTGPVNVGQPRLSSDLTTTATIIQGRTIIHQGNVRVFNPGQIRAIRLGQPNQTATTSSSIQIVQGKPTSISAGATQQLQQHLLQQQKLQTSDHLVLSNGPIQINHHQGSSGSATENNTPMDQSSAAASLTPSSRTFISTSSASSSKQQFIPVSTVSSNVALNQQQLKQQQSQVGGRSVQSNTSKLGQTSSVQNTPSQPSSSLSVQNRNKTSKELTSSGKPRQLLINPLTGHLEPMPSESSSEGSDEESSNTGRLQHNNNLKKVKGAGSSKQRTPVSKGYVNSKGGVIQHRQHVTTTTTGVTVARVVKSTPDALTKSVGQSKDKSAASASSTGSHKKDKSAEAGEKIKLRLKLEKKEPISPAYKVDVSFVKKSEKTTSSVLSSSSSGGIPGGSKSPSGSLENPGESQPRVPPLHISLRGKNAAVVVQSGPARSSSVDEDFPPGTSSLGTSDHSIKGTGAKSGKRTNKRVRSSGGGDVSDIPTKISRPRLSKDNEDSDGLKGRLMVSMTSNSSGGSQIDPDKVSITAVQVVSKDLTLSNSDNFGAPVPLPGPAVKLKGAEDVGEKKLQEKSSTLPTHHQPTTSVLQASSLSLLYQHLSKKEDKSVISTTTSTLTTTAVTVTTTTRSLTPTMNTAVTTTTSVLTLTSTNTGIGASVMNTLSSDVSVSSATKTNPSATLTVSTSSVPEGKEVVKLPPNNDSSSLLPPPPPLPVASTLPAVSVASGSSTTITSKNIPKLIRDNKPKELDLSAVSTPISVIPPSPGGRSTPTSKSPKPLPDLLALTPTLPPAPVVKRSSSESPTKELHQKSPTPPLIPVNLNQGLTQSALPSPISRTSPVIPSSSSVTSSVSQVKGTTPSSTTISILSSSTKGPSAPGNSAELLIHPIITELDVPPKNLEAKTDDKSLLGSLLVEPSSVVDSKLLTSSIPSLSTQKEVINEDTRAVNPVVEELQGSELLLKTVQEPEIAAKEPPLIDPVLPSKIEIPLVTEAVHIPIVVPMSSAEDECIQIINENLETSDKTNKEKEDLSQSHSGKVEDSSNDKLKTTLEVDKPTLDLSDALQVTPLKIPCDPIQEIVSEVPVTESVALTNETISKSEDVLVKPVPDFTPVKPDTAVLPPETETSSQSRKDLVNEIQIEQKLPDIKDSNINAPPPPLPSVEPIVVTQKMTPSDEAPSIVQSSEERMVSVKNPKCVVENDKTPPSTIATISTPSKLSQENQISKSLSESEHKATVVSDNSVPVLKKASVEDKKTPKKLDRMQNCLSSKVGGFSKLKSNSQKAKGQVSKPKVSIGTSIDADLPILTPAPSLRELLEKEKERSGPPEVIDSHGGIKVSPSNLPSMSKIDAAIERAIQDSKTDEKPVVNEKCKDSNPLQEEDLQTEALKTDVVAPPVLSTIIPNAPLPFPLVFPKPPDDPNGGHGEDSGIDSMDALSEKSPNQGESPARKEIEQFIVDTKDECNYEVAKSSVTIPNAVETPDAAPVDWVSKTKSENCVPPGRQIIMEESGDLVLPQETHTDVPSNVKDENRVIEDTIKTEIISSEPSEPVQSLHEVKKLEIKDIQVKNDDGEEKVEEIHEEKITSESKTVSLMPIPSNTENSYSSEIKLEQTLIERGTCDSNQQLDENKTLPDEPEVVQPEKNIVPQSEEMKSLEETKLPNSSEQVSQTVNEQMKSHLIIADTEEAPDKSSKDIIDIQQNLPIPTNTETSHIDAIQELNAQALKTEVKKNVVATTSRLVNAKVRKSKLENIVALIGTKNIERQMHVKTETESPSPSDLPQVVTSVKENVSESKVETTFVSPSPDLSNHLPPISKANKSQTPVIQADAPPVIAKKSLPPPIYDMEQTEQEGAEVSEKGLKCTTPKISKTILETPQAKNIVSEPNSETAQASTPAAALSQTVVKQVAQSLRVTEAPPISIVLPARATSPQKPVLEPQVKVKVRSRSKAGIGAPSPRRGGDGPPKLSKATETDPRPETTNPPRLEMPLTDKERNSPPSLQVHNVSINNPQTQQTTIPQVQSSVIPASTTAINQLPATRTVVNHTNLKTQIHSVPPTPQAHPGVKAVQNVIQISRASPIQVTGPVVNKISIAGPVASVSNSITTSIAATHIPVSLAAIANAVHHATATATTGIGNTTTTSPGQTLFAIHPNLANLPANLSQLQSHHGSSSIAAMLPGGQKIVPVKLVTIPRQGAGHFQTIPLSGINASRASPNILEAVNIVANAGNSRSSSPKTIQFHQGQGGTSQINLSSIQTLAGGGNLHLVPISMASGSSNPVKVLVSSPIKMQHQSLHHQPMQIMKSVMVGQQATTIRVVRPVVDSTGNSLGVPVVPTVVSAAVTNMSKQPLPDTPPQPKPNSEEKKTGNQLNLQPPVSTAASSTSVKANSVTSSSTTQSTPAELPKPSENSPKISPVALQQEVAGAKQVLPISEHVYKHVDELEVLDDSGQNEEDDLPYEADIIHDEKDLEDVLAGCEVVDENGLDYETDMLKPDSNSKSKATLANSAPNFTAVNSNSPSNLNTRSSKPSNPHTRSPSPHSDVHGEDQEIIDSFTCSPSQPKLSPQNKPLEEREESPTKPELTEMGKRLDEELSIEIPPVELMVGSPSQGNGSERKDHSDLGGERKSTRSTRSNTRLVSPDITAFRSDTPKPSKFTAKADPLILRNSPKPSPTGSLKLLSPSTSTSVLAVTPSSSNRSSPVNHMISSGSAVMGASVSLSTSIDKITGIKKSGKRRRQESDSSSCTSENAPGTEEKSNEIDLNSRPGKRRCSENAAELIKVQIGVEDTPKRNAMLTKRLEDSNKLKEAKSKKKEIMATVVEENEDDTESIESSLSSRGRGRSSRGSSEDRSSSRGSSVQRSGSVAKSITNEEPKVKTKSRPNQAHKPSGRDSPDQNVVKRKLKDGAKKGAKRPAARRGIAKEKSPLVPSKGRTNVRKEQGHIVSNASLTPVAGEKTALAPSGSSGAETENSRRKTRSSAAVSVDASDADGALKRRRISKDTKS